MQMPMNGEDVDQCLLQMDQKLDPNANEQRSCWSKLFANGSKY